MISGKMKTESSEGRRSNRSMKKPVGNNVNTRKTYETSVDLSLDFEDDMKIRDRSRSAPRHRQGKKSIGREQSTSITAQKKRKAQDSGMENGGKKTKRNGKGKVDMESDAEPVVNSVFPSVRIRTSPKSLLGGIRCMNDRQKKCVLEMGFGSLLGFQIDELPAKLAYYVVENFDAKIMAIKLPTGSIKVSEKAIHDILGVPLGGVRLDEVENIGKDDQIKKYWARQFKGNKDITAAKIKRKIMISTEADLLFKLNFITLFVNTLGSCSTRGKADQSVLEYIKEDTDLKSIDWSRYLWMCIKECKKGWSFDMSKKYFAGPATILTLLYLDGTKCTSIQVERIRPAMLKWNYDLMSYREEEEIKNGGFGKLEIVRDYQRIDEDDQKINKFGINDWLLLTFKPENVKEYMDHLGTLERLINGQQEIMQTIAREACEKYPSHEEVKKWMDKLELMFGREQHMYTTPKKNVQKECADKSGENMKGGKMGSPPSPFWFCATLERTVSKVEKEASLRRSREISMRLNHDDVPSFSLGLTQDMDNVMENETLLAPDEVKGNEIVLSQSMRGKEVDMNVKPLDSCEPAIANVAAKLDRGRRNLKLPATFKSPYVKRVVDIRARLSKLDMKVWQLLNDGVGNSMDIVFATKNGCESVRDSVCSLARQGWVAVDVIDSWAALLNIDEEKRNISSPFRLFCHTGMTRNCINQQDKDEAVRMKLFMSGLVEVSSNPALMTLKDVDLIFFPILQDRHYYLICYNLKTSSYDIIDNQVVLLVAEQKYGKAPKTLHTLFMKYLENVGHTSWSALKDMKPSVMEMNWRTTSNSDDCGVFLMRHMECFMGERIGKWECGLDHEGGLKKKQIGILRKHYTTKLLMSPHNLHRNRIVKEANEYASNTKTK